MYKDIKSNIIYSVRQGENVYPFLFATFLNDLEDFFLENHNVTGLLTISQDNENIMNVYMNIFYCFMQMTLS